MAELLTNFMLTWITPKSYHKMMVDQERVTLSVYCFLFRMSNSLCMVDRAEIEQLEPFLKEEKARQQMTQTLLLICAHYHRQKSRP